jgi:hypothetical protein
MPNLITLEEYKTYKGINSTTRDSASDFLITNISQFIKNYCNRTFIDYYTTASTVYFDGVGISTVFVPEIPLNTVSTVSYSLDGGLTYTDMSASTDYVVDNENGEIYSILGYFIPDGYTANARTLRVTYTGGYATAPVDIKLACADLVHHYLNEQYVPKKVAGAQSMDTPVAPRDSSALPAHIKRVLEMYRL